MRAAPRLTMTSIVALVLVATAILPPGASAAPVPATTSGAARGWIVLLKDQHTSLAPEKGRLQARRQTLERDQAPVVDAAKRLGGSGVHQFGLLNGLSVTLTSDEAARLAQDPAVRSVVPDLLVQRPQPASRVSAAAGATESPRPAGVCPSSPAQPLLEPEALQAMNVADVDGKPAAQDVTTGAGVKVAFLADGIDIDNPDLERDGKSIFSDYQDFSGDGTAAPTSGAEAFGDASAIAAQGNQTYDLAQYVNPAHPLPAGCTIKVRGVAPGATLVGLKIFPDGPATTGGILQAIDYAVATAAVDVINESFGGNPYPDNMDDPVALANSAAVRSGVTVVASTGDSGTNNTIGSPASSPDVISAAATTTFRSYAQEDFAGINVPGANVTGWNSGQISSLSSGGFTDAGRVPSLAAPGDLGWALCSADTATYFDCGSDGGPLTTVQDFGGTSQASPFVSGVAALVIAAYRGTHDGQRPSPALVKRILTSTATDLGHPAYEQGAGQVDALAAVHAAQSVAAGRKGEATVDTTLLLDRDQLVLNGTARSTKSGTVRVTNDGRKAAVVRATTRSLTKKLGSSTGSISITSASAPTFLDVLGRPRAYTSSTFVVGAGADRLDFSAAYTTTPTPAAPDDPDPLTRRVSVTLIDPNGKLSAYSIPQGLGNYAHVDVRLPAAGRWKALFYVNPLFDARATYEARTSDYASFGSVSPKKLTLAAGASKTLKVRVPVGKNPGDTSASLQLATAPGRITSVPVAVRASIPTSKKSNVFTGVITGGNGRDSFAQTNPYYVQVPKGKKSLSVAVRLDGQARPGEVVTGLLVDPHGQPVSVQTNFTVTPDGDLDATGSLQLTRLHPEAGRWRLILFVFSPVAGDRIRQPFSGALTFTAPSVTSKPKLPRSTRTKLKAGQATTASLKVKNTSAAPKIFFADPRLDATTTYTLAPQNPGDDQQSETLPFSDLVSWLVPTRTRQLAVAARSTLPVQVDAEFELGGPEVLGGGAGNEAIVAVSAPEVAPGPWFAQADEIGPFGTAAAPTATVAYSATARTAPFDPAVTSSTGDYWQTALVPAAADAAATPDLRVAPVAKGKSRSYATAQTQARAQAPAAGVEETGQLVLQPGESGTITVAITPKGKAGTKVSGDLDIGTMDVYLGTADTVATLPYAYTVG